MMQNQFNQTPQYQFATPQQIMMAQQRANSNNSTGTQTTAYRHAASLRR
jgi:hypothetical protein